MSNIYTFIGYKGDLEPYEQMIDGKDFAEAISDLTFFCGMIVDEESRTFFPIACEVLIHKILENGQSIIENELPASVFDLNKKFGEEDEEIYDN